MTLANPSADAVRITAEQSPSKLRMWHNDCRQKWAFIYVEGLRRPPAAIMAFGRAWDAAISDPDESYWAEVMKGNRHLTPTQLGELFDSRWAEAAKEVEDWEGDKPETLQDLGQATTKLWQPTVGAVHHPIALQHKFQLGLRSQTGDEFAMRGILDSVLVYDGPASLDNEGLNLTMERKVLGANRAVIHDDKTAGKTWLHRSGEKAGKPNKTARANILQALAYTTAAVHDPQLKGKVDSTRFTFDVALRTKTPELQRVDLEVTPKQQAGYLRLVENTRAEQIVSIDSGYFFPNRGSNLCSRKWCPWADECIKIHGGEVDD